jgi:hypothetical protein
MTDEQTQHALNTVRKHLGSMLEKLEAMKAEQEQDLKSLAGADRQPTELALAQTLKLIDEIAKSQANIEAVLLGKK